ncbi:MAG TPA: hypothetical protein VI874_04930, partial [Candidatus Norongarragalinales archaeon]|nr:hypothetical protein [Candidatus Norongarragalinales archaeon]
TTGTDTLVYAVSVTNDQDTPLRNVTLSVTELPPTWTVQSESVTISPHNMSKLTVSVTRNSDEGATPKISVLSDGRLIAQHSADPVAQRPSLTGRVITEASQNAGLIVLVLVLVAAAFMLSSRNRKNEFDSDKSERRKDLLIGLKTEVNRSSDTDGTR